MTRDEIRLCKAVVELLVATEPRPARIDNEAAWTKAVHNRLRAENWPRITAAVEADPSQTAEDVAGAIRAEIDAAQPKRSSGPKWATTEPPEIPTFTAADWAERDAQPCTPIPEAKTRIEAMRDALRERAPRNDRSIHA